MPLLQIVAAAHCAGCELTYRLADHLSRVLPTLTVEFIDLDAPGAIQPAAVFAVPTYLLDGRILWLGNPDPTEAVLHLQELLHDSQTLPEPGPPSQAAS